MTTTLTIDGSAIHDIPSLYAELNRVLMPDEEWTLGESLDGLDDLLYGGFGVLDGPAPVSICWLDHDRARDALGLETTLAYYEAKLARPQVYSVSVAQTAIAALRAGTGPTYFDLVLQVFRSHPNIDLSLV